MRSGSGCRRALAAVLLLWLSTPLIAQADPQGNSPVGAAAATETAPAPESRPLPAAGDLDRQSEPVSDLRELVELYQHDLRALSRRYDARGSAQRRERLRGFFEEWGKRLETLDLEQLNAEGRVDLVLLRSEVLGEVAALDLEERRHAEVAELLPFADDIFGLHDARRQRLHPEGQSSAHLLDELRTSAKETREALERGLEAAKKADESSGDDKKAKKRKKAKARDGASSSDKKSEEEEKPKLTATKTAAHRAARYSEQLREVLRSWFDYANGYDPVFSWWAQNPHERLDKEIEGYVEFLRKRVLEIKEDEDAPIVGDPVGRVALLEQLKQEMLSYSPEELVELAEAELAWCEEEMRKAARDMGFGDDWKAALEKVKNLHVGPGAQPDMVRELADEATEYVESRGLVTVPPLAKEVWRMEMMSPERQKMSPFFLGGEAIIVSFPTDTMTHEQKLMSMRGNNRHFSRATVHHELIPGHHLQGFMTRRYNAHRSVFSTPFWGEGWALYWEMRLWDLGFPQTPEDRIGMLFWRMHRCARVIWSLGFHLGETSPQEAVEFLVERVGHERENALAEVRRSFEGTYPPLYQAAYLIGGMQFYALHQEFVESGRMSEREFHDTILRGGRMPVAMVRQRLSGTPLTSAGLPEWRFAENR